MVLDAEAQRHIAALLLGAIGELGFALAGSGALREHGLSERPTQDVDIFATSTTTVADFGDALHRAEQALRRVGYQVTRVRAADLFARLVVESNDGAVEVDLAVDWRQELPVVSELGPVLSVKDAVANKVLALYSRAEVRDFLDLDSIRQSGRFSDAELLQLAREHDEGFDPEMFAAQLQRVKVVAPERAAPYGLDDLRFRRLQARLATWPAHADEDGTSDETRAMEWSRAARSVWGKSDPKAFDSLPLVQHLEDAAGVMGHIWDTWVPPIVRRRLAEHIGSEPEAKTLACWLAGVHDIGKATPAFAVMAHDVGMGELCDEMERAGLKMSLVGREQRVRHTITGQVAVTDWLRERHAFGPRDSRALASVVGAHHGKPPAKTDLVDHFGHKSLLVWGDDSWAAVRAEILDTMAHWAGVGPVLDHLAGKKLPGWVLVELSALVIVADWLASDSALFPYVGTGVVQDRLAEAVDRFDLPPPWQPDLIDPESVAAAFAARFPRLAARGPNQVQAEIVRLCADADEPSLVIVEAPTGSGKTEAALLAAESLAVKHGCGGVFIGLPTMATSDAMFGRALDWMESLPGLDEASTFLAHGKAGLNEEYQGLMRESWIRSVFDDDADALIGLEHAVARVSSWLRGRKKGLLANFVVGTIDQVLMAGLKVKHVALRHLALCGKVVIIDEVHAADEYMQGYLQTVLGYLGSSGTPVVLLSATLPPAQRERLIRAYRRDRLGKPLDPVRLAASDDYPRITVAATEIVEHAVGWTGESRELRMEPLDDGLDVLVERLRADLEDGGCVGIIRNTVKRAQETYRALVDHLPGARVELLHSRYIGPHRMAKERQLREALGPPDQSERPDRLVVVGTQVLEQSLDIDLDLLVTDLAPVDLILQRVGRLHRHQRDDRSDWLRQPRCLVTGVEDWGAEVPEPVRGSLYVYGAGALLRSAAVLQSHLAGQPIVIPGMVPALVRAAYDESLVPPDGWLKAWEEAERDAQIVRDDKEQRSRAFRVAEIVRLSDLTGWIDAPADDRQEGSGAAQVRDSEDGLEVILVQRTGFDTYRTLPGVHAGADRDIPTVLDDSKESDELVRQVAACTVGLPFIATVGARFERTLDALEQAAYVDGWQKSRWLKGQLVLPLDADLTATAGGLRFSYTAEEGLDVSLAPQEDPGCLV